MVCMERVHREIYLEKLRNVTRISGKRFNMQQAIFQLPPNIFRAMQQWHTECDISRLETPDPGLHPSPCPSRHALFAPMITAQIGRTWSHEQTSKNPHRRDWTYVQQRGAPRSRVIIRTSARSRSTVVRSPRSRWRISSPSGRFAATQKER